MFPMIHPPSPPSNALGVGPASAFNGETGPGGPQSPAQRQQKMLRQRQLALERQKRANKNALGPSVIAQAHDLPVIAQAYPKAAGWNQLLDLGATGEKPPGLHQEPGRKTPGAGIANKSRTPLGGVGATIISTTCTTATARGMQPTSDVWDKQSAVESALLDMNQPIEELNLAGVQETVAQDNIGLEEPLPERKKEKAGWNLEIEEVRGGRAAPDMDAEAENGGGKRWFRPWKKQPTAKKEDKPQVSEATSVCNFEDVVEVPSRGKDDGRASPLSGWDNRPDKTVATSTPAAKPRARRQVNEESAVMSMSPMGNASASGGEEERTFKRPPRQRAEPALPGGIDFDDGIEAIASMN